MTQQDSNNRKRQFKTLSGLELPACAGPAKAPQTGSNQNWPLSAEELPGQPPYTRGIHTDMYRGRLWTVRQYSGFGSATQTNQRFHEILTKGGSGLSTAFDLPTQLGLDADHQLSQGEVGRVGVSISTIEDMRELLKDIPLEQVSLSMTINATAPILLAFVLVLAEQRGLAWNQLRGTVQNDILKEYLARGNYIYPPEAGVVIATDLVKFCSTKVPNWNSMSISGYHIREAGSTAVQELAFTFANALEYIDALVRLGLNPAQFIGQLAFFFNAQIDFLEEIAKFRAARRIWSSLLATRYQVIDPDLLKLRFHTQTAGSSLTAQQPLNNLARTSIEAMAAIFGGTQSLHTNAHDEALGLPTAASATSALRIQQIIAEESGVVAVADPLAGSYLIEDLTSRIEQEVRGVLSKIESLGGMLPAIKSGWAGEEIEKSAFAFQKEVEANERLIVGVNVYQEIDRSDNLTIQKIDAQNEQIQIQKLLEYKKSRDQDLFKNSLESLRSAAQAGSELMPQIVACVRAGATVGEISDILRSVYGLAH